MSEWNNYMQEICAQHLIKQTKGQIGMKNNKRSKSIKVFCLTQGHLQQNSAKAIDFRWDLLRIEIVFPDQSVGQRPSFY